MADSSSAIVHFKDINKTLNADIFYKCNLLCIYKKISSLIVSTVSFRYSGSKEKDKVPLDLEAVTRLDLFALSYRAFLSFSLPSRWLSLSILLKRGYKDVRPTPIPLVWFLSLQTACYRRFVNRLQ